MFGYYFNIGIIYLLIGFTAALVYHFIFRRRTIGRFWGALIVGILGSFFGALIDYLFHDLIAFLANLGDSVNVFPPIITAFFALWILWNVSTGGSND